MISDSPLWEPIWNQNARKMQLLTEVCQNRAQGKYLLAYFWIKCCDSAPSVECCDFSSSRRGNMHYSRQHYRNTHRWDVIYTVIFFENASGGVFNFCRVEDRPRAFSAVEGWFFSQKEHPGEFVCLLSYPQTCIAKHGSSRFGAGNIGV